MKKTMSWILALVMCLSLAACGEDEMEHSREIFQGQLKQDFTQYCRSTYAEVKKAEPEIADLSIDGDTWTAKGKLVVTDNYGDIYTGKFTVVYTLNEDKTYFHNELWDLETPTKQ